MISRYSRSLFLDALFAPYYREHRGFILVKSVESRNGRSTIRYFPDLVALARERWTENTDVSFGICPRDLMRTEKDQIRYVVALWAELDIDPRSHEPDFSHSLAAKQVAEAIRGFPFIPSVLVGAGRSLQLYWLLRKPCEINDARAVIEVLGAIAKRLGSGRRPSLTDLLKLPHTFTNDTPVKFDRCHVKLMDSSLRYDLEHFFLLCGASPGAVGRRERVPASPFVDVAAFRKSQMPTTFEETVTLGPDDTAMAELDDDSHTELTIELIHSIGDDLDSEEALSAGATEHPEEEHPGQSDSRFMREGLAEDPVTVELTGDLLAGDLEETIEATLDPLLGTSNVVFHNDLTLGTRSVRGSETSPTGYGKAELDSGLRPQESHPSGPQPPLTAPGGREPTEEFEGTRTVALPEEEIRKEPPARAFKREPEMDQADQVPLPTVAARATQQADSQTVSEEADAVPKRPGLFDRAGGILRGFLGSKTQDPHPKPEEKHGRVPAGIPGTRGAPATVDGRDAGSHVAARVENRAPVTLVCGQTLCRLFAEGMKPPSSVTARIRPGMAFRGQPLDIFHGTKKVGSIILPDMWLVKQGGGHLELTARHDGDYLEVGVLETESARTQLLRVPLAPWDDVEIAVEPTSAVSIDEAVSVTVHARALSPDQHPDKDSALRSRVGWGSSLAFRLSVPDLPGPGPQQELVWLGNGASVNLALEASEWSRSGQLRGILTAIQDTVPLGQLELQIASPAKASHYEITGVIAHPFRMFFVLSAAEDGAEVAGRLRRIKLMGRKFLPEPLDLESHDPEDPCLHSAIHASDAVLLFWSENARKSAHVVETCRYAVETKGAHRVIPVLLQSAPAAESPSGLGVLFYGRDLLRAL